MAIDEPLGRTESRQTDNREFYEKPSFWLTAVLTLFAFFTVMSAIVQVGTGEVGVVTRFGEVTGRELPEGIHLKTPWIEKVWHGDTRVQKEQASAAAASLDLQDVNSTIAVNYHLDKDKVSEIFQSVGPEYKARLIDPAVQESFKSASAEFTVEQLIQKRSQVKDRVVFSLKNRLHKRGIIIDDVSIVNFRFSPEFNNAIEDKQVAQQNAARARFNLEQAKLDAQAQNVQKATLSQLLLDKQRIENQRKAIEKWNGTLPTYWAGNASNLFNIPLR